MTAQRKVEIQPLIESAVLTKMETGFLMRMGFGMFLKVQMHSVMIRHNGQTKMETDSETMPLETFQMLAQQSLEIHGKTIHLDAWM